ncbi:hypothetical protein CYMTET_32539, partial [Cymbomonas tetramitiformis]
MTLHCFIAISLKFWAVAICFICLLHFASGDENTCTAETAEGTETNHCGCSDLSRDAVPRDDLVGYKHVTGSATKHIANHINRNDAAPGSKLVELEGGEFIMGSEASPYPSDQEGPIRKVTVEPFSIDKRAITNADFAAFVFATDFKTDAEEFGWSFVFELLLSKE